MDFPTLLNDWPQPVLGVDLRSGEIHALNAAAERLLGRPSIPSPEERARGALFPIARSTRIAGALTAGISYPEAEADRRDFCCVMQRARNLRPASKGWLWATVEVATP
jgi:hypothetical protein